jgi:phosphoribosylformylglycinamidine synthase
LINGKVTGDAPSFEIDQEVRLQKAVLGAIRSGLVSAAHDCSEGGLLVALTEMTFGAGVGAVCKLPFAHNAADIFGEGQSRIVVSVPAQHVDALVAACAAADVPTTALGITGGDRLEVADLVSLPVADLKHIHATSLTTTMTSR